MKKTILSLTVFSISIINFLAIRLIFAILIGHVPDFQTFLDRGELSSIYYASIILALVSCVSTIYFAFFDFDKD